MENNDLKVFTMIFGAIFLIAVNFVAIMLVAPALVSAASTVSVVAGILLCVVIGLFDLFVIVRIGRSLYNKLNSGENL